MVVIPSVRTGAAWPGPARFTVGMSTLKLVLPVSMVRRMVTVTTPPMGVWVTVIWSSEKLCEPLAS